MIFKSPCVGCPNAETRSKDGTFESVEACSPDCVVLACYQKALSIAEKVGVPKPGTCAICHDPSTKTYCSRCVMRVSDELDRKRNPPPIKKLPPRQKINPKKLKWFYIPKLRKPHICEICNVNILVGDEAMARHTAPGQGNYRHAHRSCIEGWEEEKAA